MFDFFASIFGYVLNFIYELVNSYGIAIILFTVLLKLVMLPLSIKQQKTMEKSAKIQEKAREIQEKYAKDQVRQSQELMDLYKKENMSPFSGCLSSIVQMIIILSIFFLISRPLTFMKHIEVDKINGYTEEIKTTMGDEALRYPEISIIQGLSDKYEDVRINMDFFGLDLSEVPSQDFKNWKVYIIPVLYVITSIISTKITTNMSKKDKKDKDDKGKETNSDEVDNRDLDAMEEMNKQMALMMPIMAVSIAIIAPLGLALYWLVSNILMILERLIINKWFKDENVEESK